MKKRVISFILVLATLVGIFGTASVTSMAAPTCYQQGDARWGGIYYGNWNLAASGCGILSTVNAVNYLTGNFIHPTELAAWGKANNFYNGSYGQGTVRATFYANVTAAFGSKYGFKVTNLTWSNIYNATLRNHLQNGGAAIVHCPNHFMAITAYNASTGKFLVYDSAANPTKRNTSASGSWLTADQIHGNTNTRVDWFCLVTRTGKAPTTTTTTTTTTNTLYTVSASVASGSGNVHFGNNVKSAQVKAGTVINYQTTPASGYKVSKILVGGTAQTIKNNGGDCVYQFTMPKGNCGVVVTFTKIATANTLYTVSASVASGSGNVHFGNNIKSAQVYAGTLINFQTTPASGYKVSKILVGGKAQTIKNNGGDCVYQFTMPAGNCSVVVTFEKIATTTTTYKVRCGTFSVKANADNYVKQLKAAGFSAYVGTVNGQYVVYAGTFSVKANANNLVAQLKAKGFSAYVSTT